MNREEIMTTVTDSEVRVNTRGDLMMKGELRPIIGKIVKFKRLTKKGLIEVIFDEKPYYVPPKNIEAI